MCNIFYFLAIKNPKANAASIIQQDDKLELKLLDKLAEESEELDEDDCGNESEYEGLGVLGVYILYNIYINI